ncbi:hypothetical protein [Paenibacillus xylaniclasticus]|uniref:hypothetical protein n=1 Tax=Paenibacillus xylaniclasticus TaxID=588083 RepID=UPI000FD8ACBC|nr:MULTISPECIES: hypothetical protein [Paenibacillus]GFN33230.1 hypothetical protein PCURB6_34900 [Paenibacillus curdlanolyticus]
MVEGWVTTLVVVFGVAVAVLGVVAYLRMFRKDAGAAGYRSTADNSHTSPSAPSQLTDTQILSDDGDRSL